MRNPLPFAPLDILARLFPKSFRTEKEFLVWCATELYWYGDVRNMYSMSPEECTLKLARKYKINL